MSIGARKSLFPKKNADKPDVTVTVTFNMTNETADIFKDVSIEDVISLSVDIVTKHFDRVDAVITAESWDVCRPMVQLMWNTVLNAIHNSRNDLSPPTPVTLVKGEVERGE